MVWLLLRIWGTIGVQSFGGGASTLLLIQREFIARREWLTTEEMARYWNLCLLTPGINLIALTVLIGRKMAGTPGIVVSLVGLLAPSVAITCVLTALFDTVQHNTLVQAALHGVVPATGGVMAVVLVNFARPLVTQGRQAGPRMAASYAALVLGSAAAIAILKVPVAYVLAGIAVIGALGLSPREDAAATKSGTEQSA